MDPRFIIYNNQTPNLTGKIEGCDKKGLKIDIQVNWRVANIDGITMEGLLSYRSNVLRNIMRESK